MNVRTRIAPSPTGEELHIGNLYTAILNYAWAQKNKGDFIVRIEDTDQKRLVDKSEQKILSGLRDYKINYSESPDLTGKYGPYRQSERLNIYHEYTEKLLNNDKAYFAFLKKEEAGIKKDYSKGRNNNQNEQNSQQKTPKTIKEMIELKDWVVKLRVPKDQKIKFHDLVRGEIEFDTSEVSEQVLIKSDGFPTYHLAVVVDDYLMKITHVIRAEDWISSTPKHILLYKYFGWDLPYFAHVPLLRNPDKSKLSKRRNPVWVSWYIEEGYLPEAVVNYLTLMGWSHPEQKEIFNFEEFVSKFELKDLKTVGPVFDLVKLTWMNQQYILNSPLTDLENKLVNYDKENKKFDKEDLSKLVALSQPRMSTLKEFTELTRHFFEFEKPKLDNSQTQIRDLLSSELTTIDNWNKDKIFNVFKKIMTEQKVKMKIFYLILTGSNKGLPLPETIEILGKQETLKRLK